MLILAIDTTGLFSSLALLEDGNNVLFMRRESVSVVGKNWRDFPYILPQKHQDFIFREIDNCFKESKKNWDDIDAIAVSAGSGIYTCVITGLSIAKTWSKTYKKKLIKVDHVLAHIYSAWIDRNPEEFKFPILTFSASGSHSDFSLLKSINEGQIIFDEIPKEKDKELVYFVGVGKNFYRMAKLLLPEKEKDDWKNIFKYTLRGNPHKYSFKNYYYPNYYSNFLTKIKTSGPLNSKQENKVLRITSDRYSKHKCLFDLNFGNMIIGLKEIVNDNKKSKLSTNKIADLAASFEHSLSEIIVDKIMILSELLKVKEIHIAGGISANQYFEKLFRKKTTVKIRYPKKLHYKLDNAAMIGSFAYYQKKYKIKIKGFKPVITK